MTRRGLCVGLGVLVANCGQVADSGPTSRDGGSDLYASVLDIVDRRCAIDRCHAGPILGGGLAFERGADHGRAMVDVPACSYPPMNLVEPHAPERSWLMVKLTAPFRPPLDPYATYIYFTPAAGFRSDARPCADETDDGTPLFGQRMPATAPNALPEEELAIVRAWIEAGAPL